ncbi:MAG: hypothetical protein WCO25_04530 [Candidatus Uhrbacteria bacterium]
MLKKFLWFSRHPADEREAVILSAAYQRALTATWAGLGLFLFFVSPLSGVMRSVGLDHAVVLLEAVLFASMFAGWTAVRREHLEFVPVSHKGRLAFWNLALIWLAATFAGMLPIFVAPRLFYVSIFGVFVVYVLSAMVWAANWTKSYTLHSRILATFLLPFQTVGFLLEPKAGLARRMLLTLVLTVGVIGVPLAIWVPFMNNVASASGFSGPIVPGIGDGLGFHPIIADYRLVGGLQEGDIVEFGSYYPESNVKMQMHDNFLYGRVNSITGDSVSVEVEDAHGTSSDGREPDIIRIIDDHHTQEVSRGDIFAKVILDAPLSHWLYR